jgi:hypothetical protein
LLPVLCEALGSLLGGGSLKIVVHITSSVSRRLEVDSRAKPFCRD